MPTDTTATQFVAAFKRHRTRKGLNQPALADKSGVAQTTISDIECGRLLPGDAVLQKLAIALELSRSQLMTLVRLRFEAFERKQASNRPADAVSQ